MCSDEPIPIVVTVVGTFDLGLLVQTDDTRVGQLRLPDMKPRQQKIHIEGRDCEQLGTTLTVYMLLERTETFSVSEWSPAHRKACRDAKAARAQANATAAIEQELTMVVRSTYSWGYLCDAVDSPASGAIFTADCERTAEAIATGCPAPTPHDLAVGERVVVRVVGKNANHGALILGWLPGA